MASDECEDLFLMLEDGGIQQKQFRKWLSERAKPRPRMVPVTSPEDIAKRLEEKLLAAEKKREKRQALDRQRRARLEATRQLAKTEAQSRHDKKLALYESKIALMESKRAAMLEGGKRRRAAAQERILQLNAQREAIARLDDERLAEIHAALMRRLAAAERKRCARIAAERTRAAAVFARSRQVATSVWKKREAQSRAKRETWEGKLARARFRRAEIMRQRGGCIGICHSHGRKHAGERLSKKLSRCWRQFRRSRDTTLTLAEAFVACHISREAVKRLPFENLAARITSPSTLQAVKAFLQRVESRLILMSSSISKTGGPSPSEVSKVANTTSSLAQETKMLTSALAPGGMTGLRNLDHLLRKLQQPKKTSSRPHLRGVSKKGGPPLSSSKKKVSELTSSGSEEVDLRLSSNLSGSNGGKEDLTEELKKNDGCSVRGIETNEVEKGEPGSKKTIRELENQAVSKIGTTAPTADDTFLERYPARVFLCAYMILGHPDAVFSSQGKKEKALAEAAALFVTNFEMLIAFILQTKRQNGSKEGKETRTLSTIPQETQPVTLPRSSTTGQSGVSPHISSPTHVLLSTLVEPALPLSSSAPETHLVTPVLNPDLIKTAPSSPTQECSSLFDSPLCRELHEVMDGRPARRPFAERLLAFDDAWSDYLELFVKWKVQDAEVLGEDLVGVACQLEESMHQCRERISTFSSNSHDFVAIKQQVKIDHQLLRDRLHRLCGAPGVARMEAALIRIRNRYPPLSSLEALETSSPSLSSSPTSSGPPSPSPSLSSSPSRLTASVRASSFSPPLKMHSTMRSPHPPSSSLVPVEGSDDSSVAVVPLVGPSGQTVVPSQIGKGRSSVASSPLTNKTRRSPFRFPEPKPKQALRATESKGEKKTETGESLRENGGLSKDGKIRNVGAVESSSSSRDNGALNGDGKVLENVPVLKSFSTVSPLQARQPSNLKTQSSVSGIRGGGGEEEGKLGDEEMERMVQEMFYGANVNRHSGVQEKSEKANPADIISGGVCPLLEDTEEERRVANISVEAQKVVENAFWDVFRGHLLEDPPQTQPILNLVLELRDELEALSPASWQTEIRDNLDLEILGQILNSSSFDFNYLRQILDYVSGIFLRLGAPARDTESEQAYQKVLAELAVDVAGFDLKGVRMTFATAITKGLRFMFEQLKILKRDVKQFQLSRLVSFVQGRPGVDFQRDRFTKRFKLSPSDSHFTVSIGNKDIEHANANANAAGEHLLPSFDGDQKLTFSGKEVSIKLPKTFSWLVNAKQFFFSSKQELVEAVRLVTCADTGSSVSVSISESCLDRRDENSLLSETMANMKTGGGRMAKGYESKKVEAGFIVDTLVPKVPTMNRNQTTDWGSTATVVRLGLIQIVTSPNGTTEENVPETLRLDVMRIRNLQNDFQRILLTAIGLLLVRTVGTNLLSSGQLEAAIEFTRTKLPELLKSPLANMDAIAQVFASSFSAKMANNGENGIESSTGTGGMPFPDKEMMKRLLMKALMPDDVIFARVSAMIASALRALILGTKNVGLKAAQFFLKKGGGASLLEDVVHLSEEIEKVAEVTVYVHEPWYKPLVESFSSAS